MLCIVLARYHVSIFRAVLNSNHCGLSLLIFYCSVVLIHLGAIDLVVLTSALKDTGKNRGV